MATLSGPFQVTQRSRARARDVDDTTLLGLELQELAYVDTARERQWQQALRRWPLLAELEQPDSEEPGMLGRVS
ncbi:BcsR/BcsP family cellulose biosynthesis protein [Zobellella iuensis]|uniref:Cellulose biosynthesis protein BcsR n=1 Tax=Zobellella iuensis TaxID=2803811 RepID=A0ABS1QW03_9GAMM|nr:BcsR/BcsP family cellulose biosynthesis protein [Zobellella iuensis]MBL1379048.1 hypothetical protein [Zobellella iuensis]